MIGNHMVGLNRIGTSFLLSLSLLGTTWSSVQAQPANAAGGGYTCGTAMMTSGCGNFTTSGTPACNGTSAPAEVTVTTASSVQITIGNKVLGVGVSQTHQASYTQTLQPGECIAIEYSFECCRTWYGGWSCESSGTALVSG